jgi:hypothetical protein
LKKERDEILQRLEVMANSFNNTEYGDRPTQDQTLFVEPRQDKYFFASENWAADI